MKSRILILSLAIFAFSSYRAEAQVDVTINPVNLIFGTLTVGGDFLISDEFSVEGIIGYTSRKDKNFSDSKYTGIPVMVVGKYYFNPDDGADKFYAAAFLRYVNRSYTASGDSIIGTAAFSQTRIGAGLGIGTKMVSRSNVVFDFGVNIGRVLSDKTKLENPNDPNNPITFPSLGIIFNIKLGIGYRFGS